MNGTLPNSLSVTNCADVPVVDFPVTNDADGQYLKFTVLSYYNSEGGALQYFGIEYY